MIIDNFDTIKTLLNFENDYFYFIQIIQRKKEIPNLGSNNRIVRSYMISSVEKFDKIKDEVIQLCEMFNARAYIHLNRRRWSNISIECLKHNADLIASGQHEAIKSSLETIVGRNNGEHSTTKTWIVDIDNVSTDTFAHDPLYKDMIEYLTDLQMLGGRDPMIKLIKTRSGWHIITKPFNTQLFTTKYPNIDIHKDNPTVLYVGNIK